MFKCSSSFHHYRGNNHHNTGGGQGAGEGGGRPICSFMNSKNLHFHNEHDIHISFENYKESDYEHDFDSLIISHSLRVSNPTRSGCKEEINVRLKAMYLDTLSLTSSSHCCRFIPIIYIGPLHSTLRLFDPSLSF